jgi:hypothetical protein
MFSSAPARTDPSPPPAASSPPHAGDDEEGDDEDGRSEEGHDGTSTCLNLPRSSSSASDAATETDADADADAPSSSSSVSAAVLAQLRRDDDTSPAPAGAAPPAALDYSSIDLRRTSPQLNRPKPPLKGGAAGGAECEDSNGAAVMRFLSATVSGDWLVG